MKTVYSVITPVNGVTKNNPGKLFYLPQDVLEWAGRICYNSNKHFRKNPDFLYDKIVTTGHLDVLEHGYFGCEFEVEPLFDVGDLYYFYYIFKEKYPFMSISLLPGEKKIGMYGNFRVWYNLFCDNYAQIWGFIGRQDMQELQIWLSTLVPNVFHYPQWLNGQKNTIGKLIQDEYANSFSNTSSHKVYTTSDGVDVMMLSRTPKSDFTNRFHVAFQISKCSREMTHQLVRHRLLSFSQRSQRYVDESNFTTSRPKSTPEQTTILDNHFKDVNVIYKQLRDSGMKKQDARCILPNATHTELVVSGTDVGWKHFLKLRCASDAQEQIRNVAFCMKDMMEEEYGSIIF